MKTLLTCLTGILFVAGVMLWVLLFPLAFIRWTPAKPVDRRRQPPQPLPTPLSTPLPRVIPRPQYIRRARNRLPR